MVASAAAKYPGAALIDYGATKAAMISMSKSLGRKYGADGVLINSADAWIDSYGDVGAGGHGNC